jgi:hypothetical protein
MAQVGGSVYGDCSTSNMVSIGDLHCSYSYVAKMLFWGLWLNIYIYFVL